MPEIPASDREVLIYCQLEESQFMPRLPTLFLFDMWLSIPVKIIKIGSTQPQYMINYMDIIAAWSIRSQYERKYMDIIAEGNS